MMGELLFVGKMNGSDDVAWVQIQFKIPSTVLKLNADVECI